MKQIESMQNALVKHWRKLQTKKERDKTGEYVVEGFHLVEEAVKSQQFQMIMVNEGVDVPADWHVSTQKVVRITPEITKMLAETEQTQGIFALCAKVERTLSDTRWNRLVLIDAVQDPGNVGTMIRTADAAGYDAVLIGKGTADPYNAKTLRSAQGSHFHIPVIECDAREVLSELRESGLQLIGTGLAHSEPYDQVQPTGPYVLIVGNEGSGVQPAVLEQVDQVVQIPLYGQAESLNVAIATGILLYHYRNSTASLDK